MTGLWATVWAVWLLVTAISFGVLEWLSWRDDATLSAVLRRWLGVDPPRPWRRVAVAVFVNALTAFVAWFVPHVVAPAA